MKSEIKTCQNCHSDFSIDPEDFLFYEKIKVPPPTWCPECRMIRRMVHRNEKTLYKDQCDLCGQGIISTYSPEKPFKVYCRECWYSDKWDPLEYGRDYDWSRPFFSQFRELLEQVPRINLAQYSNSVNSNYANFTSNIKNVYLAESITDAENVYYSRSIDKSREVFDCLAAEGAEIIYENIEGYRNYKTFFCYKVRDSLDSSFLFDCVNCQHCFMSSNLRNGQYVFRNKQLSKDQYQEEIKKIYFGNYLELEKLRKEFGDLVRKSLHKFTSANKVVGTFSGNNVENTKNAIWVFDAYESENLKYCERVIRVRDVYDVTGSGPSEMMYEVSVGGWGSSNFKLSSFGHDSRNCTYVDWCHQCSDLFACAGVRNKKFCVLNKQYNEEDYEKLVSRIIKQMDDLPYVNKKGLVYKYGEFFPIELAPYFYNETVAAEYFPLTKDETIAFGYKWQEPESKLNGESGLKDLPNDILEVDENILNEILICIECGKNYRLIQPELNFFQIHKIALPRKCSICRYKERFKMRTPLKLWHRQCMCGQFARSKEQMASGREQRVSSEEQIANSKGQNKYQNTVEHFHGSDPCPNEFETSYAPERPEMVYCEECYNNEIL